MEITLFWCHITLIIGFQIPDYYLKHFAVVETEKTMLTLIMIYSSNCCHIKKILNHIKKILEAKENFFFSVNLVARKKNKSISNVNPYISKFLAKTSWVTSETNVLAGKSPYPKYSLLDKNTTRCIMFLTNGPTNTSRCYEFTNWYNLNKFA